MTIATVTTPMEPEAQQAFIVRMVKEFENDPRLLVIVLHDDGAKTLVWVPEDERGELERREPRIKGVKFVFMTFDQARNLGVFE